jgi:hypothetical protein
MESKGSSSGLSLLPINDEQHPLPSFTRENIEITLNQMYPGCKVLWSKSNGKKHKAIILIYGDKEPLDLLPFAMEGSLLQIARTIVTMFACCQNFTLKQIDANMKRQNARQQQVVTVGGIETPQQPIILSR